MKYIVIKHDDLTQEMLDLINGEEITQPFPIYVIEPDLDSGTDGIVSDYLYITTEENYPLMFAGYKKFTEDEFNEIVASIQSRKRVTTQTDTIKIDDYGHQVVGITKPNNTFVTLPTHNFCDTSSWTSVSDSTFTIRPPEGKKYFVTQVEVQVINNVTLSGVTTFYQEIKNDSVGVVDQKVFDSILKVMDFANKVYHVKKIDNMVDDGQNFIFDYPSSITLDPSDPTAAHELVYYVSNSGIHVPTLGQYLTVSVIVDVKDV